MRMQAWMLLKIFLDPGPCIARVQHSHMWRGSSLQLCERASYCELDMQSSTWAFRIRICIFWGEPRSSRMLYVGRSRSICMSQSHSEVKPSRINGLLIDQYTGL